MRSMEATTITILDELIKRVSHLRRLLLVYKKSNKSCKKLIQVLAKEIKKIREI